MQADIQKIVDTLTTAIIEHRLKPGLQMAEDKLMEHFKVPPLTVQLAMHQLVQERLVVMDSDRGACVASPSLREAREVFEVRRLLEVEMVRLFVQQIDVGQIRSLRNLLIKEKETVAKPASNGRSELQGDFHIAMAELLGNTVLVRMLRNMINRCALISLMYKTQHDEQASNREHIQILEALTAKNVGKAVELMEEHLLNEVSKLTLHKVPVSYDNTQVFESSYMATVEAPL
ncbi:MAG: GntR family transcriptional regulator [Burkholderiaceae bacterium]